MEVCGSWRKLTLLLLTFLTDTWAQIELPQTKIAVIQGEMVVLKVSYRTDPNHDLSTDTIIWNFVSNKTQLIISYTKGSMSMSSAQFEGRVGFISTMPSSNVSLYINNTKKSDSGRYFCQIIIPNNPDLTAEITLDVKVPPAPPRCSLSGKPTLKGNVTLGCWSSYGTPVPTYSWRRTSPTSEVFFPPSHNEKTGRLLLTNLTSTMAGSYECSASNSAGNKSCTIRVDIISSTNAGVIVGATLGSVFGFVFLLVLCMWFVLRRRRDTEDDMANDIKEDAQAPKRVSWAKSGMGSDIISKNGTLSSIASSPHHKEPYHHDNHQQLQQYPQRPPSDTASIITATGSTAGYRPSHHHHHHHSHHHGASTPTPTSNHYSYNTSSLPGGQPLSSGTSASGSPLPRPERHAQLPHAQVLPQTYSQPQAAPSPPPLPASTVTAANIARMGGVPIMVPAQNQAGSLV